MTPRNLVEAQVLGGFAAVVLAGETVDSQVVSSTIKPDNDPATNWKSIGCIKSVAFEPKKKEYTRECPNESGGYSESTIAVVVEDMIVLETDDMSDITHALQFGMTGLPTPGTTQAVFEKAERKLLGWLKIQGRKLDGSALLDLDVWCEITLKTAYKFSNGLTANALGFKVLKSAGNGIKFADPEA